MDSGYAVPGSTLTAVNGAGPLTSSKNRNTYPQGISMSLSGVVTGTPQQQRITTGPPVRWRGHGQPQDKHERSRNQSFKIGAGMPRQSAKFRIGQTRRLLLTASNRK